MVRDIQKAVKQYWKILGIGPWAIYTLAPPSLAATTVRGESRSFSMKVSVARVGSVMLELIQPLEGESIYEEFLAEKGEGIHHIASYGVDNLDGAITLLEKRGISVFQSGTWRGTSFAYMNTEKALGAIIELVKRPKPETDLANRLKPEATYP